MSVQQLSLEFSFVLYSLLSLWQSGNAVPTLTALPDEVCYGVTYQINCSHPVLDGSRGYLHTAFWNRNGTVFVTDNTTEQSVSINTTVTGLQINITKGVHEPGTYYSCHVVRIDSAANPQILRSNNITVYPLDSLSNPFNSHILLRSKSVSISWSYDKSACYKDVFFNITVCLLVNGAPDPSQCTSYTTTNLTITVESLTPNTSYIFMITAQSVQYPDITSDTVKVKINTLDILRIALSEEMSCTEVKCGIGGEFPEGSSSVVWMKDGMRIDECEGSCVIEDTLMSSILRVIWNVGSMYNREANYSCAVVYADGSMEESEFEPVTVSARESPLPPTSLTSIPSDTSVSLMWTHSDECFENCTFMYEVTWQQNGDGSSLRNTTTTETFYTIEGLTPGTSYEIGIGAYCEEDLSIKSEKISLVSATSATATSSHVGVIVGVCVGLSALLAVLVVAIVILTMIRWKRISKHKHPPDLPDTDIHRSKDSFHLHNIESTNDQEMERNPAYIPIEMNQIEDKPIYVNL